MILCIVGPSCAGKSTAAKYISNKTEGEYLEASDYVRRRHNVVKSEEEIIDFVKEEFRTKGKETFAKEVLSDISDYSDDFTIIAGYRTFEELEYTKSEGGNVNVIGIYCNSLLRYQRKLKRDKPGPNYEYEDFILKDFEEYDFGIIKSMRREADEILVNESSVDDFEESIEDYLDTVNC